MVRFSFFFFFMPFSPLRFASFWDHANSSSSRLVRHFNGEESFDTGPMAPTSEQPAVANSSVLETSKSGGTKL